MVTATLTAAAVKAQIATQRQRVAALEASLGTMVNGMDKHMVQVQLKYAQGYLEALLEQLSALQGHQTSSADSGSSDASADSAATNSTASTITGAVAGTVAGTSTGASVVAVAGSHMQPTVRAAAPTTEHGHAMASAAAQACIDQQQSPVQYSYFDMRPAVAAAAAATARQQQVAAAATATGHGPEGFGALTLSQTSQAGDSQYAKVGDADVVAAGGSSLVDEDDWVCLQDAVLNISNTQRSGWAGLWNWRKADA